MDRVRKWKYIFTLFVFVVAVAVANGQLNPMQRLMPGFYGTNCSLAEAIVTSVLRQIFQFKPQIIRFILRMHFNDCFVHGCDGSILIAGANSERNARPNRWLSTWYAVIDEAKTRLENTCPNVVSCADILAPTARDVVVLSGGPRWSVPLGRLDGKVSLASDVILPEPSDPIPVLKQAFASKGLDTKDLITLARQEVFGTYQDMESDPETQSILKRFSHTSPQ